VNAPVVVQVPITNGKPDLQLPADVELVRDGSFVHVSFGDGARAMTLRILGTPAGQDPVLCGVMTPTMANALVQLGAKVMRLRDAWLVPAMKTWLLGHGVTEVNGAPVPPHGLAGEALLPDGP
jgi:hypothetical protein